MQTDLVGKSILTLVLIGGALMSFLLDWGANHLQNPLWHPHARYHAAILLFLFAGVASVATWLLWRPSREPNIAITSACLISLSYWTPFFYVPYFLPIASYWAGVPGHQPRISGMIVYPNLVVATVFVLFTVVGWWLARGRGRHQTDDEVMTEISQ